MLFSTGKIDLIRDRQVRLQELEAEVQDLARQRDAAQRDAKAAEDAAATCARELAAAERRGNDILRELQAQRFRLLGLENEQAAAAGSLTLGALQEDLRACQERLAMLQAQFTGLMAGVEAQVEAIRGVEAEMAENAEQQAAIKEQHELVLEELHKASTFRRNADKELGLLERAKEAARAEMEAAAARHTRLAAEVEEAKRDVAFLGQERPPCRQSRQELERELGRLRALLEELVRSQPDPEALLAEITELKDGLARSKRLVETESFLLDKMARSLEQRKVMWNIFRKHIGKISNMEFILMLQARGFQGRLEYDAGQKTLHIRVRPQAQVAADSLAARATNTQPAATTAAAADTTERDIRQLSGGEKSYSTACFLFSLWTAMSSPLRALDEFDVFMDQVNRDFVINELMKNARSSKVQFILITPNAIWNSIKGYSDDTKIIRLENPDRAQIAA